MVRPGPTPRTALAGTALVFCAVLFAYACVSGPQAYAGDGHRARGAGAQHERELQRLRSEQSRLEEQLVEYQQQILYSQNSTEEITSARDSALAALTQHLVSAYKQGDRASQRMLASGSVEDALNRAQLIEQLTGYEQGLVEDLDAAQQRAGVQEQGTGLLERNLLSTQTRLTRLRLRIERLDPQAALDAPISSSPTTGQLTSMSVTHNSGSDDVVEPSLVFGKFSSLTSVGGGGAGIAPIAGGFATDNASAEAIDAYLTAKQSPMAGTGIFFMASGQRWGIDPRLVVAIAGAESGFGNQTCAPFNAWGWGCPSGPYDFASRGEGIETVTKYLRLSYIDQGFTTVTQIQTKYAPSGAANDPTNLNNNWVTNVSRGLVELGGDPNAIILTPTGSGFGGSSPVG